MEVDWGGVVILGTCYWAKNSKFELRSCRKLLRRVGCIHYGEYIFACDESDVSSKMKQTSKQITGETGLVSNTQTEVKLATFHPKVNQFWFLHHYYSVMLSAETSFPYSRK